MIIKCDNVNYCCSDVYCFVCRYSLKNLKFGKIDVSRYPLVAEKYAVCVLVCERERERKWHVVVSLCFMSSLVSLFTVCEGQCVCLVVVVFFVLMCWLCLMLLSRHMYLTVLCRFAIHVNQTAWCVGFI